MRMQTKVSTRQRQGERFGRKRRAGNSAAISLALCATGTVTWSGLMTRFCQGRRGPMTHDMRKIRSAAGRQPAYLNAFPLTRFPR